IFDDIYCGPVIIDTVAPEILSVAVTSSTTLDVSFSEKLDSTTSTVEGNYSADVLGNPVSAIPDANDLSLVHLEFSSAFPEGELLTLTVTQVTDQSGNPIGSDQGTFFLYEPKAFDVLINEVFTDQTPAPVGIPAKDYIELRNRTGLPLNLSGWTIQPRSTSAWLPFSNAVIQANGYLIVCVSADVSAFSSYGAVIGVSSFSLNNEGTIVLRNDQGVVIHSVDYIDDWYHDDIKKDGGWAMEQVDAANPCGGIDNWKASTDVSGGTPGRVNSVDAQNPDQTAPSARLAIAEDSITVLVYFNETLDSAKAADISGYSISNGIGAPALAQPIGPAYSKVRLVLAQPLQRFTTYILSVGSVVNDCAGNAIGGQTTIRFAISEVCEAKDLLINEILYNPKDNGSDYIELYNNSQKVLDLKYLRMCLYDTLSLQLQNQEEITTEGYLVFPGEYVLLSEDTATVRLQYFTSDPTVFCQPAGLPAMGNSGGVIAVATDNDVMTDMLKFDTGMQFRLLDSDDGIALERINFTRETNEWSNWHSAAESVGYGTPGLPNSQYFEEISADGEISIEPEIFSPDNDGYQDVLNIYYKFGSPGCVANVSVYSPSGRRVRQLVVNELLGAEGVITWDGVNDDNEKSRIGIYVIYFEVFGVSGSVQHYKRACTIGAKF
ncbi:MAG: lamin tail domain-containing protein, partial [Bacteroidetes bacterium]|nr:lamin tail domain-containing protein [Bacteroidota bacterium]